MSTPLQQSTNKAFDAVSGLTEAHWFERSFRLLERVVAEVTDGQLDAVVLQAVQGKLQADLVALQQKLKKQHPAALELLRMVSQTLQKLDDDTPEVMQASRELPRP